jgi:hypothetical protein
MLPIGSVGIGISITPPGYSFKVVDILRSISAAAAIWRKTKKKAPVELPLQANPFQSSVRPPDRQFRLSRFFHYLDFGGNDSHGHQKLSFTAN